jgi:hypothetical protein
MKVKTEMLHPVGSTLCRIHYNGSDGVITTLRLVGVSNVAQLKGAYPLRGDIYPHPFSICLRTDNPIAIVERNDTWTLPEIRRQHIGILHTIIPVKRVVGIEPQSIITVVLVRWPSHKRPPTRGAIEYLFPTIIIIDESSIVVWVEITHFEVKTLIEILVIRKIILTRLPPCRAWKEQQETDSSV